MEPGRSVAVIGSGISGLAAAWLIAGRHRVDLYEAADRPGGHVNTVNADIDGRTVPVDTGFIVHNPVNFPNIVRLFGHLGIATEASDMSFAVSARGGALEYAGGLGPRGLLAQRRNLARPEFWGMISDILRFNRHGAADLAIDETVTLGDWLAGRGFGRAFREEHLLPMTAAIWSTAAGGATDFPAAALFRFLHAHGLLRVTGRPRWRTVTGGCRTYVDAVIRDFAGNVYLASPVRSVAREERGVTVTTAAGDARRYDAVIMATHADTTLSILDAADGTERSVLGAIRFARNRAVLHRDPAFMPRRRAAWASWNYITAGAGGFVTYWMSRLQNLPAEDLFVTLDPPEAPADTIAAFDYDHPQFDVAALRAQREIPAIQGKGGIWHCGAWCGYGFHEDGLVSAMRVAEAFGVTAPWIAAGETA